MSCAQGGRWVRFLDREVEAQLKPAPRRRAAARGPGFLDREVEAQLKRRRDRGQLFHELQFPRPRGRGPIEAALAEVEVPSTYDSFLDREVEAQLKPQLGCHRLLQIGRA